MFHAITEYNNLFKEITQHVLLQFCEIVRLEAVITRLLELPNVNAIVFAYQTVNNITSKLES